MFLMDHLVCLLPGTLALNHLHGVNTGPLRLRCMPIRWRSDGKLINVEFAQDLRAMCSDLIALFLGVNAFLLVAQEVRMSLTIWKWRKT